MSKSTIEIATRSRACDNCGNSNPETLWSYERTVTSRSKKWHFKVNNVICPDCGFVYVSPAYTDEILGDYYADSATYFRVDYSIDNRMSVINRYAKSGTYVELGAKDKTEFHQRLENTFERVLTQELGDASDADLKSTDSIQPGTVDMVAHYFVLEHVPSVRAFLSDCRNMLKEGGIMIVEVPDLALYHDEIAALMLYEHTNHFSVEMLDQIAQQVGFELLESGNDEASRQFGFYAVFQKAAPKPRENQPSQHQANKAVFNQGLEKVNAFYNRINNARKSIDAWVADGKKVLVWAANDNFDALFDGREIPQGVTIIDSDPRKENHVDGHTVLTPGSATQAIAAADAIVLCTGQWSKEILDSLAASHNKTFDNEHIRVVDYFFGKLKNDYPLHTT